MNTNLGKARNRGGRPMPGRRGNRPQFDKSVMNDGVYANPRLVHTTLQFVGCKVQVQVKNGGLYEGIFKTTSPLSQIVLDLAHKVEPSAGPNFVPSRDMIINSIIFNLNDIVYINAANVELDFASRDTFTDTAISKMNNGGTQAEKELTPWESEGSSLVDHTLESAERGSSSNSSANGWDADDMFKMNAEKFDIKSSYDPNLTQYTTPLVKKDTKEYREREAMATRLAQEIEKSDDYKFRVSLENGGENDDEEMVHSAVHRPGENNNNSISSGKYVPPHMRKSQPPSRPVRMPVSQGQSGPSGGSSPHAQSPSPQMNSPNRTMAGPSFPHAGVSTGPVRPPQAAPNTTRQPQTGPATRPAHQATTAQVSVSSVTDDSDRNKDEHRGSDQDHTKEMPNLGTGQTTQPLPVEGRKMMPKGRERITESLMDFKNTFKLGVGDSESKDQPERKPQSPQHTAPSPSHQQISSQPPPSPQQPSPSHQQLQQQQQSIENLQQQHLNAHQQQMPPPTQQLQQQSDKQVVTATASAVVPEKKDAEKKDDDDRDKKFSLNPNAKEFVPGKSFTAPVAQPLRPQQHPMQVPTPPRATQSPVILQQAPPIYHQIYINPNNPHGIQNAQAPRSIPKRVAVSVQPRPDLAAAQAAAATGQPLLQTPIAAQNAHYAHYPVMGGAPTLQQVLPQGMVQMAGNTRMVTPQQLVQGATTPTDAQLTFQQSQHPQHVFMHPQQGHQNIALPGYMGPPPMPTPGSAQPAGPQAHTMQPTHMAPHHHPTPPHSQAAQNHQGGGASGGHPTPSPVPQPASHPQVQNHPPQNSGTPQPHQVIYQHAPQGNPQQAGHPPLQPSPHTPTSPQSMYPQGVTFSLPYTYTSQPYTVQPHMAFTSTTGQYTTVTPAHHQQHHSGQVVMVTHQPNHHNTAGVNHHLQHSHMGANQAGNPQHTPYHISQHPQGHQVQGPMHGQAGPGMPINVSSFVPHQTVDRALDFNKMVSQQPQPYHHNQ